MKHIVHEINSFTRAIVGIHEFDDSAEAFEWAFTMNQLMEATPIRYVFMQ